MNWQLLAVTAFAAGLMLGLVAGLLWGMWQWERGWETRGRLEAREQGYFNHDTPREETFKGSGSGE